MPRAGRVRDEDATGSRRRRSSSGALRILILIVCVRIQSPSLVEADCWYDSMLHAEGDGVETHEACLNCTCNRGALLCYLRVCTRLPNPPPSGCVLVHRHRACCPELFCMDAPLDNSIEARSDMVVLEDLLDGRSIGQSLQHACIVNGSLYAPGSAMDSSTDCEFCYCIAGEAKCIRPTCLLPLDGCVPSFMDSDCCPVRYNCTRELQVLTTTTTSSTTISSEVMSCVVDGRVHVEGSKIIGIGHSVCDNCYCLRGLVRCEPLSCASPLSGCTPVLRPGECCAASYNCSGAIETQPEANYGQFPIVSKEYAKLRKEVQHKRTTSTKISAVASDDEPYYVIAVSEQDTRRTTTTTVSPKPPPPNGDIEDNSMDTYEERVIRGADSLSSTDSTDSETDPTSIPAIHSEDQGSTNNLEIDVETTTSFESESNTTTSLSSEAYDLTTEIEKHQNSTSKINEGDFNDYIAPTLPPSLPNLRIIPFVAADALLSAKHNEKQNKVNSHEDLSIPFVNRFSPPDKTEGGFLPKGPASISDQFYDDYGSRNRDIPQKSVATEQVVLQVPPDMQILIDDNTTHRKEFQGSSIGNQETRSPSEVPGLLKLAGCNIYGRMYRIGRIILELSGPCVICTCTEVGVQCEDLKC